MEIRTANSGDTEKLIELRLENAIYHSGITKCLLKIDVANFFKTHTVNCLKNEDCKILIATVDTEFIGYIIGFVNQQHPIFDFGKEALIDDFFIKPIFRKKGYGKTLYDELLNWFLNNNVKRINLNVYEDNSEGQIFWYKQNFKNQFNRMIKEF